MKMNSERKYNIDDLIGAWRQQCDRIDRIVEDHPATEAKLSYNVSHISSYRRLLLTAVLRAMACLVALVCMALIFDSYVVDTLDLISHLLVCGILLYAFVGSLRTALLLLRRRMGTTPPLEMLNFVERELPTAAERQTTSAPRFFDIQTSRVATIVAIIAIVIVVATPAYDGRSMSDHESSRRTMSLASSNDLIEFIVKRPVQ